MTESLPRYHQPEWLKAVRDAAPVIREAMQRLAQSRTPYTVFVPLDDAEQVAMALMQANMLVITDPQEST